MHTAENIIFAGSCQQAFGSLISNWKCILSKSEYPRLTIVFVVTHSKKVCKIKIILFIALYKTIMYIILCKTY